MMEPREHPQPAAETGSHGATPRGGALATVRAASELVWRASPGYSATLLGITVVNAVNPIAVAYATASILGLIVEAHGDAAGAVSIGDRMVGWLLLLAGLTAAGYLIRNYTTVLQSLVQQRVTNQIQWLIAEKAGTLDLADFERSEFYNDLQNASVEASSRPVVIVQQVIQLASSLVTVGSLAVVVYLWHPWLLPVVVLPPLLVLQRSLRVTDDYVGHKQARTEAERRAAYFRSALAADFTAKEVRLFGLKDMFLGKFRAFADELYRGERAFRFGKLKTIAAMGTGASFVGPLLIGYAACEAILKVITVGQFSFYTQALAMLKGSVTGVAEALNRIHESDLFLEKYRRFMARQPVVEVAAGGAMAGASGDTPEIEFRNVSFRYPGAAKPVLENVSFILHPGERVALVGPNGSGKTTLVKLLTGLYHPTSGQILVDGVDAKTIHLRALRSRLSVMFQDFVIYHMTIADNLRIGALEDNPGLEELEAICRRTGFHSVVEKLPARYDTGLGNQFKHGHQLSGGQRQLLAFTRMLCRKARVYILDEPTAALDAPTERRLFDLVIGADRVPGTSAVVVAHRLASVRQVDRIFMLDHGVIVGSGSHRELYETNALYARMCDLQEREPAREGPRAAPASARTISTVVV